MGKRIIGVLTAVLIASALLQPLSTIVAANEGSDFDQELAINKVRSAIPDSIWMTDKAIDVLSQGLIGMSQLERELFLKYYDPGNTGDIDDDYVASVYENFQEIRSYINENVSLIYESNSGRCVLMTLYYTDFIRIHVCPYVIREVNQLRIARGIVHEAVHMAFLSFDRSYYYPNFSLYEKLKPDAHPATNIPVIGYIIREVLRTDTLYNADTYAKFAAELSSLE